jgi:hypothetical protein
MPERFVEQPYHLARHLAAPCLEERRAYLSHLVKEGRAFATLKCIAVMLLTVTRHLRIGPRPIKLKEIERAAECWLRHFRGGCSPRVRRIEKAKFIFHARSWLLFLGKLDQVPQRHWFSSKIEEFRHFQAAERGLADTTVVQRGKDVNRFLLWIGRRKSSLKRITVEDVSLYLQSEERGSWKRTSIGLYLSSLRAFFRFAESRGWCQSGLGDMIDGPRLYRHERLPRGPKWKDVQRLLEASRKNTPTAVRNYVLLSLFAIYGFRSSEVSRLRLDDIDWERETISLIRRQTA